MEVTRRYFCYGKSHATTPGELKLIGTIREVPILNYINQINLYQCPVCKSIQLIEETIDAKTK